ncbi:MAG: hypothetical protein WA056_10690 [Gallionella sp.]
MKCWICGCEKMTGEHIPKASTMRDLFGSVTQQRPLYHSSAHRRNRRMQSINSELIKYQVLCGQCNSTMTQPYDRAWDVFWSFLNENGDAFNADTAIRFYRIFGYGARNEMLNLHLYAVKLFGCVAAEFSIPLDIAEMADAISHRRPYPNIYVGLGKRTWLTSMKVAGPSDVWADLDCTGRCVFAVWFLAIGEWEFQFIYAVPGQKRDGMTDTWNPIQTRRIRLKNFDTPSNLNDKQMETGLKMIIPSNKGSDSD